jgi:hypothetical protein
LKDKGAAMKRLVWFVGAMCAAAAGFLVIGSRRVGPVEDAAQSQQDGWSEHHTTA